MDIMRLVEATANQPVLSVLVAILLLGNPTLRRYVRTLARDVRHAWVWFRDLPDRAYQRIQRNFWSDAVAGCLLVVCPGLLLSLGGLVLAALLEGGAQTLPAFAMLAFTGFAIGFSARFTWATLRFVRSV